MSDEDGRPKVSIHEAEEICGVSRRTIYNWLHADKVEFVRTPSGSVRIYRDSLFCPGNFPKLKESNNA